MLSAFSHGTSQFSVGLYFLMDVVVTDVEAKKQLQEFVLAEWGVKCGGESRFLIKLSIQNIKLNILDPACSDELWYWVVSILMVWFKSFGPKSLFKSVLSFNF